MRRFRAVALFVLIAPASAQVRLVPVVSPLSPAAPLGGLSTPSSAPGVSPLSAPALTPSLLVPFAALPSAPALTPLAAAVPVAAPDADAAAPAVSAPAADPKPTAAASARAALPSLRAGASLGARHVNSFWDGFASPDESEAAVARFLPDAAGSGEDLPSGAPFLALRGRGLQPAFERGIALARSTKAGAQAFDEAEAALGDRTIPVEVKDLGRNYGEWDYLNGRLRLDRKLFEPGREVDLAGTLAHELKHVAQHALGLPSNALELEIEAHLLNIDMMEELGLKAPPHTFSAQLVEALKKGPDAFIELLEAAVPGSPYLGAQSLAEIRDQLEQDLDDLSLRKGPRAEKLSLQVEMDLRLLRSKKGRETYEAFSKRVQAELKRRAAAAR